MCEPFRITYSPPATRRRVARSNHAWYNILTAGNGEAAVDLSPEIAPDKVDIDTGVSLGLVVNEFIANSVKHAFGDGYGAIRLAIRREGTGYSVEIIDRSSAHGRVSLPGR